MNVKESGRFRVRSGRGVPPLYFTGLEDVVPDTQEFPGIGPREHFNIAECTRGGSIEEAVLSSLANLPLGASSVVLVGTTKNPKNNTKIAVLFRRPD